MASFPFYKKMGQNDAGPTCLRMISKYYGKSYSQETLCNFSSLLPYGINMLRISEAAEAIGMRTTGVKKNFDQLANEGLIPCIAHFHLPHDTFIVVYKIKKNKVYVAHPADGLVTYSKQEFLEGWTEERTTEEGKELQGLCLLLEPTPDFHKIEDEEIFSRWLNIKNYHSSEAKIFLVGNKSPEKSALAEQLFGVIKNYFKSEANRKLIFNILHFEHQERMSLIYSLYLRENSLYLLLCNTDINLEDFEFWIDTIKLFSDHSPLIIVLSEGSPLTHSIDEIALKKRHKNIVGFHRVNLIDGKGITYLTESIKSELLKLPITREKIPDHWFFIRSKVEYFLGEKDYIDFEDYRDICNEYDLTEPELVNLTKYLQDKEIFVYFEDNEILQKTIISNPNWVIDPICKILDSEHVMKKNGKIHFSDFREICGDYPGDKLIYLLELMKKFNLCLQVPNTKNYIITELMPDDKPGFEWDYQSNLRFEYQYEFIPPGFLTRFITQTYNFIKSDLYWKNGVVLELENTEAFICQETQNKKIGIQVKGDASKELLTVIRTELVGIHKMWKRLDVKEMIGCICYQCKNSNIPNFYSVDDIELLKNQDKKEIVCPKSTESVLIEELRSKFIKDEILFIDAADLMQEFFKNKIESLLYEARSAKNGKEGIEIFQKNRPYLVIMNLWPGDIRAELLIEKIRDVPIIIYTQSLANKLWIGILINGIINSMEKITPNEIGIIIREAAELVEKKKKEDSQPPWYKAEQKARRYISGDDYLKGREWIIKTVDYNPELKQRLFDEFGFLYSTDNTLEEDEKTWKKRKDQVEWRRKVWEFLSVNNPYKPPTNKKKMKGAITGEKAEESGKVEPINVTVTSKIIYDGKEKTPEQKGEELENDMLKLFEHFLILSRKKWGITLIQKRKQSRGDQSGYDLKFVFENKEKQKLKILVECKNYEEYITLDSIAGKLDEVKNDHPDIDHWILISPRAKVANKVDRLLDAWEKTGEYPFGVQLWTREFLVDDFFGLYPEIYDKYFSPGEGQPHPKDWDEKKRHEVIDVWRQKLEPTIKLPEKWKAYLKEPHKLRLSGDPKNIEDLLENGVTMMCKDETGQLLKDTLEAKVRTWLEKPAAEKPSLILLGDFGDGKTVFTYVFARKLVKEFLRYPSSGWIPVRFALKDFCYPDIKRSGPFVEKRLKEFGVDINDWNELNYKYNRILVILDGFDEISKKLDSQTVLENIEYLIDCFKNEFSGMKMLITSRKHFFENQQNKNKLIKRIGNPQILQMAPIDRRTTLNHLEEYAKQEKLEEKLNKLKNCHDPIGLASKPLFLEMVKLSLKKLTGEDLSERVLYESYIQDALERKSEYLDDREKNTDPELIIDNMKKILEEVALALHESAEEFVYLSEVKGTTELKNRLWNMSIEEEMTSEDEKARVAVRSLLKRVEPDREPGENRKWPVDFCHRSMREYFVARAVCNLVENDQKECIKFLRNHFLSYEIVFFAGEIMKKSIFNFTDQLKELIDKTRNLTGTEKFKIGHLGCNAINLLYQYKADLPGNDWTNLVLDCANLAEADLSGKNFSGSSLQYANLDNVNFTNAIFSKCNLTGVRLEETSPVQSIAVSLPGIIYASYNDGNIREWHCQGRLRPYSKTLSMDQKVKDIKIFTLPGNDIAIIQGQFIFFYDKNDNNLKKRATIEIKHNLKVIKATPDQMLVLDEQETRNFLQLVDLEKQEVIKWIEVVPFSICENFSEKAFVTYDENNGLQIIDMVSGKHKKLKITEAKEVTCLATIGCWESNHQYRLAVGQKDGIVRVYTINLQDWKVQTRERCEKHEKTVKGIAFIGPTLIVTGGFDRKVLLLELDRNGVLNLKWELRMNMQCRNMKTDGIIRDEERNILEGFKKKLVEMEG